MNKKFTLIISAIIFGLLGATIAYLVNYKKLGKIHTEMLVKYIYVGESYFPNHISSPNYDPHILDDFIQKSSQIIGSDFDKLYPEYNKKYQIQYVKVGSKEYAFSRTSDNSKKNKEILKKVINDFTRYSELKFSKDIKRNIISINEYLKFNNCEQVIEGYKLNETTKERLEKIQKLIDEYRNILENRKTIDQKDFIASTFLIQEAYNSLVSRVNLSRNILTDCKLNKKKLDMENLLKIKLTELLSYNIITKEKKIISNNKFLFLRGFINGILFFIFLRLSIIYFRK